MKRRVLLVDDELSILLTLKAVLEISGFDVDTSASARDGKERIKSRQYDMVITDMRMESDEAGVEVIAAARTAPYRPAVALLSAFPVAEEDWQSMGADRMLVKPMQTQALLSQLEALLVAHEDKKARLGLPAKKPVKAVKKPAKTAKKAVSARTVTKKSAVRPAKKTAKKSVRSAAKKAVARKTAKKTGVKRAAAKKSSRRR